MWHPWQYTHANETQKSTRSGYEKTKNYSKHSQKKRRLVMPPDCRNLKRIACRHAIPKLPVHPLTDGKERMTQFRTDKLNSNALCNSGTYCQLSSLPPNWHIIAWTETSESKSETQLTFDSVMSKRHGKMAVWPTDSGLSLAVNSQRGKNRKPVLGPITDLSS